MKLTLQAVGKLILGFVFLGICLFLPAKTVAYPGAWLFLALLFVPMLFLGILLRIKAPELLEKRLNSKEKEKTEKGVQALMVLIFLLGFVLSALDFRFGWSQVSAWLTLLASLSFLLGYGLYAEVMRENAFLSRTVEIREGQSVVSTGLYGIVRHPMYLATLFMFLPLPLILGSLFALIPFALYLPIIVIRILDEERVLKAGLDGYTAYTLRVRYRLIPFIW